MRALKLSQTVAAVNLDVNRLGDDGVLQVWSTVPIVAALLAAAIACANRSAPPSLERPAAQCRHGTLAVHLYRR